MYVMDSVLSVMSSIFFNENFCTSLIPKPAIVNESRPVRHVKELKIIVTSFIFYGQTADDLHCWQEDCMVYSNIVRFFSFFSWFPFSFPFFSCFLFTWYHKPKLSWMANTNSNFQYKIIILLYIFFANVAIANSLMSLQLFFNDMLITITTPNKM